MNKLAFFFNFTSSKCISSKKGDIYAYIIGVISQFFWAMSNIQLKTYRIFYPENFSTQSVTFWRSISILLIAYLSILKKGRTITKISEIKFKFWFFTRSLGNYFFIVLWIIELTYFRVSTAQCIANCSPIVVLILSSLILKETFYIRYVIGVLLSLIGTIMIVLNDKKELSTDILKEIAKNTKSISKSCKNQIEDMEVLFDENDFTNASNDPYWVLDEKDRKERKYKH
jgi:drug/metabolite transporter (DMT)-like permease